MKILNKQFIMTLLVVLTPLAVLGVTFGLIFDSMNHHGPFYEQKEAAVNYIKSRIDSPSSFRLTDSLGNKISVDEIADPLVVKGDTLFDTIYHVITPYGECGLSMWPSSIYTVEEILDYVGIYKLDGIDKIYVIGLYWPKHSVYRINYEAENDFGAKKAYCDDLIVLGNDSVLTIDEFREGLFKTDTLSVVDIGGPIKCEDEIRWVTTQHKGD